MGIELKTKTGNITLTTPKVVSGGSVDLSNYYTKPETDAKIQEVVDAIPEVDLSGYATVDYVDNAVSNIDLPDVSNLASVEYVETRVSEETGNTMEWLENNYAKKSDIPDVSGFITEVPTEYITETELEAKSYVTKTYVDDAVANSGGGLSEDEVNTLIDNALAEIGVAEEGEY